MKRLFCPKGKKRPRSLRSFGLASLKTEKKRKIAAPLKTHHEIHSRPATAINSRRRATKHVARGSLYSRASSIDPGFVEISLACIHTYPHCCCCAACIRFGALFSRQRSFCFLYCDMYLRFRGCPVVLDIELSVSAWYQKNRRVLLCARRLLLLLLRAAERDGLRCAA